MVANLTQSGAGKVGVFSTQGSRGDWENLENEYGHGDWKMKMVMEHEKLAKSHGILWSVMEF